MRDSPSVHSQHSLNARLLRFRSQPHAEDAYALVEDLIDAGRCADARSVITLAKPQDSEDAALLLLEGRAHLLERDLIRAQAALLTAVKAEPQLQPAYRYLGEVLLKRGDPLRAQKTLRRALALAPEDDDARALLERAEYLAEAANDSLEALPNARDLELDVDAQAELQAAEFVDQLPSEPANLQRSSGRPPREDEPASQFRFGRRRQAEAGGEPGPSQRQKTQADREPDEQAGWGSEPAASHPDARPGTELKRPGGRRDPAEQGERPVERVAPSRAVSPRGAWSTQDAPSGDSEPALPHPAARAGRPQLPLGAAPHGAAHGEVDDDVDDYPAWQPEPPAPPRPLGAHADLGAPAAGHHAGRRGEEAAARAAPPPPPRRTAAVRAARGSGPARAAAEQVPVRGPSSTPAAGGSPASSRPGWGVTEQADVAPRGASEPAPASLRPGKRLSDFLVSAHVAGSDGVGDAVGGGVQGAPDADQVLELVRKLGLFEQPSGQATQWVERREVEPRGQRVRTALAWLWGVTLLLCVGGYFGWNELVQRRHAAAASMVAQARELMFKGDHAALVDAERLLRLAREQHPASVQVSEEALFVQLQRVLEDGERDTAALRTAFARARAAQVGGPGMALANLLLSAAVSDHAARDRARSEVFAMAKGDPRTLYLVGRAEERMGADTAQAHLEAAVGGDPKLVPAQLALAERAYERGERAAATRLLDGALAQAPDQLRVRLFRLLVVADDAEVETLRKELNDLAGPLRKGNGIDRALAALVRARLARRGAEPAAALEAIDAAAASGVEEARVLRWLAEEALAVGNSLLAQQLASQALSLAPERASSRRLLARILVERGAGRQAFVLLASLPGTDVEVQVWKARAALLADDPELLRNALAALPSAWPKKADVDVQRAALRLRIETRLDPTKAVLDRAQRLARSAPADPDVLLALAEAALELREAKLALATLKQRALLTPDDVQAQILLGRSLRMGFDIEGAEAAFRRALALRPGHGDAQAALASLLLDRGQYEQADEVYRELALREETALLGRLGRVEALLGQGKTVDAQLQLEAAPEAERATAGYREMSAKLALASGEVGQAIKLLGTLCDELPRRAPLRALHAEALLTAAQIGPAGAEIDAALTLDPGLPEALLGRAELQLRGNKIKDALATLAKTEDALRERLRPPAVSARRLVLLGRTLAQRKKRGDADAAVRALRQVTDQTAPPADAYYFLGEALSLAKNKPAAQEAYRRYLELAPSGVYRQRAQRMLGASR